MALAWALVMPTRYQVSIDSTMRAELFIVLISAAPALVLNAQTTKANVPDSLIHVVSSSRSNYLYVSC